MTITFPRHKNKTLSTLLASLGGALGFHRFYLGGWRDKWAWLHLASLPLCLVIYEFNLGRHVFFAAIPVIISALCGCLAALVIGTTPDEKWDAHYNPHSSTPSDSSWLIALILVLTLGIGAGSLIATIARTFDLLLSGGAYG